MDLGLLRGQALRRASGVNARWARWLDTSPVCERVRPLRTADLCVWSSCKPWHRWLIHYDALPWQRTCSAGHNAINDALATSQAASQNAGHGSMPGGPRVYLSVCQSARRIAAISRMGRPRCSWVAYPVTGWPSTAATTRRRLICDHHNQRRARSCVSCTYGTKMIDLGSLGGIPDNESVSTDVSVATGCDLICGPVVRVHPISRRSAKCPSSEWPFSVLGRDGCSAGKMVNLNNLVRRDEEETTQRCSSPAAGNQ